MNRRDSAQVILRTCGILICLLAHPLLGQSQEVFIEGVLKERRDVNRSGQTVIISPSEETRFDTQSHFKSDPSIHLSGTGRAGGFTLPLFRGQDARSSHVFVDDMELQDPYSGFPMIDDIDLRAFGAMIIHKGVSPWNVPVLEPGGVVQFSMRRPATPLQVGLAYGDVTGSSGWAKFATPVDSVVNGGLYGRRSTARGDYKYFSDNNTVLNPADDQLRRRKNNDRSGDQGIGHISWSGTRLDARGLVWSQASRQGIPLGQSGGDGAARLEAETQVLTSGLRAQISERYWLGMDAGAFSGRRSFRDPSNDIGFATKRTLKSRSLRVRALAGADLTDLNWILSVERQNAASTLSSTYGADDYSPQASAYKIFAGGKYKISKDQALEVKAGSDWITSSSRAVSPSDETSTRIKKSLGASIGWSRFADDLLTYAQIARSSRAPSLLERVGNGADIEGAPSLANEEARAVELGSRYIVVLYDHLKVLGSAALWARDNDQMIRIEKIAATRWRARNTGAQKFRGAEARMDIGTDILGLELAASWMRSEQVKSKLLVPYTPLWQAAGGVRWQILERAILRSMSRFVGRMYQDASNSRELNWTLSHDVSLDWSSADARWKLGIGLNNITNVTSTTLRDTVTGQNDGRMAWAQYNGEPLPGRSWLISGSVQL